MRAIRRNSTDVKRKVERLWNAQLEHVAEQARRWPADDILAAVAEAHDTTPAALRSRVRDRAAAHARHHAAWELRRRRLDMTYQQIAAVLDRTNHATAMNSVTVFGEYVKRGYYAAERQAVAQALGGDA